MSNHARSNIYIDNSLPIPPEDPNNRTQEYAKSLNKKPAERELILLAETLESLKQKLNVTEAKYDNSQVMLRQLYQLEKEKHYFMCNALFSSCLATLGGLVIGKTIDLGGLVSPDFSAVVGGGLILLSLIVGIFKPMAMEILWKLFSKRIHSFKCPRCQINLTDRDVIKE